MRDARDVLKSPVISEKSVGLVEENKYSFWVNPAANKIEIKAAVEKMFKVSVVILADPLLFAFDTHGTEFDNRYFKHLFYRRFDFDLVCSRIYPEGVFVLLDKPYRLL